jgi:catechol 2,3-dioxygenase-like lactoylglutathione lyase family enzyme
MPRAISVTGFDHLVINVRDVEKSLRFYCDQLGLEPVRVEEWRRRESPFPSVRACESTIIDLIQKARTGENTDHFCLVVEPVDFDELKDSGRFTVVDGPGRRFGARGDGTSLYVQDPDGNVVELRYY